MRSNLLPHSNSNFAGFSRSRSPRSRFSLAVQCLVVAFWLLASALTTQATTLNEYHRHLKQAVSALDTLAQSDEGETAEDRTTRMTQTIAGVRTAVPPKETLEWDGSTVEVDNSWLHRELDKLEKAGPSQQPLLLKQITERIQALEQRLTELKGPWEEGLSKTDSKKRLTEILQRPEYARTAKEGNALARLLRRFLKWLSDLFPKPKPLQPGSAGILTKIAQIFVVLLALGVLAYAIKVFAPRFFRGGRTKKKTKKEARIVLGEKLEPDQSAVDLLADAEALARRGELRAAIRKAYIALLVELGERKIISLAQHKTNRDYLSAIRQQESLYGNVKQLTDRFERHWYGLAGATESDWIDFRARYKQALQ